MSDGFVDLRAAPRYTVIMDAQVTDSLTHSSVKLRCSDISVTGCYLDTLNPMDPETLIWVRLEHAMRVFEVHARVAYMVPRMGMGVAFALPIPAEQLAVLSDWIAHAAASANPFPSLFGAGAFR